jgi:two-component system sensor histidine kinase RegB
MNAAVASAAPARQNDGITSMPVPLDDVGRSWLVTVRWTAILAALAALAFGSTALHLPIRTGIATALLSASALSNIWLARATRARAFSRREAGAFVSADVLILAWCLVDAGGIVNPASIYFLVDIVVAALVLGPAWTWIVTALAVASYSVQLFFRTSDLSAALAMHPQIAEHVRGMWIAFMGSAALIAILVARLATAVAHRDLALQDLRAKADRTSRMTALATLTAGAAHELSTPLGTIAVAAGELSRSLDRDVDRDRIRADVALIRAEVARCKSILDAMSARAQDDDAPAATSFMAVVGSVLERLGDHERERVAVASVVIDVLWPARAVGAAFHGVIKNALDASDTSRVRITADVVSSWAHVSIADTGPGMSAAELARAGEPFYTTKPAGSGLGLGLFVSRTTIEHLGGRFTIHSAPNTGTTVTLVLPTSIATSLQ